MKQIAAIAPLALLAAACQQQTPEKAPEPVENVAVAAPPAAPAPDPAEKALTVLGQQFYGEGTTARSALVDLDGDGSDELVAYVEGPQYCGSGGCVATVLTRDGDTYRSVMDGSVSQLPIYALSTRTGKWRDLGIAVSGGGAEPGIARMRFGTEAYPDNPTVEELLPGKPDGDALITDATPAKPL